MSLPLLQLSHVSMAYHTLQGETPVLDDFSLSLHPNEFVALLGPSGCGKSTVLSLAAGLLRPDKGHILCRGNPVTAPIAHLGYMLQKDHLFPWLTVRENAALGLSVRGKPTFSQMNRIDSLLAACGLADYANRYPSQLSGGMRQRAALIRTLAVEPDLLLLDEPFSALDAQTRLKLADEVKSRIAEQKCATLLVTHDIGEAISMADRILVLSRRPAKLLHEHLISIPGTPMQRRHDPDFTPLFDTIWKEVENYVL